MFGVTKLFNIAVNDFDAKKSAHCNRVFVLTELAVSGTQWTPLFTVEIHGTTYYVFDKWMGTKLFQTYC